MYMQPWFENAPSKEELIDRTKKELEDHMEGVYSISDDYIQKLLSIKNSYIAHYDGSKVEFDAKVTSLNDGTVYDPMLADVARLVVARQSCSGSQIQRTFEIGYNRAESLIQQLENIGAVGPDRVPKDREVLIKDLDTLDKILHKFKIC